MINDYSHAFHYFPKFINDKKFQNIFSKNLRCFAISGIFLPKLFWGGGGGVLSIML